MLQNIRNNIQGPAAKIIIGLIAIPFVFFGVDSFFNGGGPPPAATVNGEDIEEFELVQAVNLQKRRLLSMMGESIDPAMLEDNMLRGPALQGLVDQKVMLLDAEEKGLAVSPRVLNRTITSMEQFHVDGQFSQERYLQVLRSMGFGNAMFKQLLGTDLLLAQLRSGISGTAFLTPAQAQRALALAQQKRSYNYLMLTPDDLVDQVAVSDEEVVAWYEANADQLLNAAEVKLSYIELSLEDFIEPVPEQDIRAEYELEVERLGALVERQAAHILVSTAERDGDEALAIVEEIQAALAAGTSFEALAKQRSEDPGSASLGGDLGYTSGNAFPETFEDALAALQPGEISDVVETEDGLHLIKLVDVKTREPASFDSRRAEIEARLQQQRAEPRLIATVEELRDLVFNADGLTAPAAELELEVKRTDWLSRDASDPLMASPQVASAAFNEQLREERLNSEVMELEDGRYVVLHVDEYHPPEQQPLEAVRDLVVERVKRERAVALVDKTAADLKARVAAGESVENVAAELGLEWQAVVDGVRTAAGIPRPVIDRVYSMPLRDSGSELAVVEGAGERRWVVKLYRVEDVDPDAIPTEQRQRLARALVGGRASQEFAAYFGAVRDSAEIRFPNSSAAP